MSYFIYDQVLMRPRRKTFSELNPSFWVDGPSLNYARSVALDDAVGPLDLTVYNVDGYTNWSTELPTALVGKRQWSVYQDGVDDYISAATHLSDMAELTCAMWFRHLPTSQIQYIANAGNCWSVRINAAGDGIINQFGTDGFGWSAVNGGARLAVLPTTDTWYHLAITYKSGEYKVYLNGVCVYTTASYTGDVVAVASAFQIGSNSASRFKGWLADYRVYLSCLGASDIALLAAGNEPIAMPSNHWTADAGRQAAAAYGTPIGAKLARSGSQQFLQSTAASCPTFYPGVGQSGRCGVAYDGIADTLVHVGAAVSADETRFIAVVNTAAPTTEQVIYSQSLASAANSYLKLGISSDNKIWYKYNLEGTADELKGHTTLGTEVHVLEWITNGTTIAMWVDGIPQVVTVVGGGNNGKWFEDVTNANRSSIASCVNSGGTTGFLRGTVFEFAAIEPAAFIIPSRDRRTLKTHNYGTPLLRTNGESATGWTASAGTLTVSNDFYSYGTASLKLTANTAAAKATKAAAFAATNMADESWNIRARFYVSDNGGGVPGATDVAIYLQQNDGSYRCVKLTAPPVGWNTIDTPIVLTGHSWWAGTGNLQAVTTVGFGCTTTSATGAVYLDELVVYQNANSKAKIVWTFDDLQTSAITTMANTLDQYGWKGAFAAIGAYTTASNLWDTARDLERRGHMIVNHSYGTAAMGHYTWDSGTEVDTGAEALAEVLRGQQVMRDNGCWRGSRIWVCPYGALGQTTGHRDVLKNYTDLVITVGGYRNMDDTSWVSAMQSRGSTVANPNPGIDNRVWQRGLLGDTSLTAANIDKLIARRGFEVIMQHNVDGANLTTAQFEAICAYIAAKEQAGLLEVSTLEREVYV